jgi:cytochrome c553
VRGCGPCHGANLTAKSPFCRTLGRYAGNPSNENLRCLYRRIRGRRRHGREGAL